MADTDPARTTGMDSPDPPGSAAFALLGDDTRLAILLALWEQFDPHGEGTAGSPEAVSFSELFDNVDYDNPGNFRYHLEQLEGQFVRHRPSAGGYELRLPGLQLVQVIVGGAGLQDVTLERSEIDQPCPFCGATTTITYREGLVRWACTACAGVEPNRTGVEGFLRAVKLPPAGLTARGPESLHAASRVASLSQLRTMFEGLCPTCSGPVDAWLECCADHEAGGICGHCGSRFSAWAKFQCRVCKDHATASPKAIVLFHPTVVSFYDDHGVSTRVHAADVESAQRNFDLVDSHGMDVVSTDPPRVTVKVERNGDALALTVDETVNVTDVRR